MSFYFAIVGTKDNPLFEHEFGSSKQGGDGIAKFPEQARHMNQFIVHSSLDIVEEVQWGNGQMYGPFSCMLSSIFSYFADIHQVLEVHRSLLQQLRLLLLNRRQ